MTLHIFTLTWDAEEKITKLKDSLIPNLKNIDAKWWIKDNASKDNTYEVAKTWGENIIPIKYPNNLQNFSEGMNFLYQEAKPKDDDQILLLNNDVIFNDDVSLKKMLNIMKNDKEVGAVGAKLLYTGTKQLQHAGVVFNKAVGLPLHFRSKETDDKHSSKNRIFQVVTGAVLLVKAKDFYMDTSLKWSFDDVDLCLNITHNQKQKAVYCGETNISHEESASLKKNPANKMFMQHNTVYLKDKWKNKIILDQELYQSNNKYNLYKIEK